VQALSALADYLVERLNDELVTDELAPLAERLPVGLLWGEHDRMVPLAVGQAAARALGMAELPVMAGVGHAPYVERPAEFVDRWRAFSGVDHTTGSAA
jgi:2-hydroxy-6-oxonona-2,4-dienedioate hydrolase